MKLERLSLANYRGFEQIDIDFTSEVTVIAGINGVGKSSLLSAIAVSLSQALPYFTLSMEKTLACLDTDVMVGKSSLDIFMVLKTSSSKIHIDLSRVALTRNEKADELISRAQILRKTRIDAKNDSNEKQEMEQEIRNIENKLAYASGVCSVRFLPNDPVQNIAKYVSFQKKLDNQPIALFYSSKRLLSRFSRKLSVKKGINISAAYRSSLNQTEVSLNDFANWFRMLSSGEFRTVVYGPLLLQQLEQVISTFLPEVSSLKLHDQNPPKFSVKKNDKLFYLDQLSDGEQGLLALAFDLVRRLVIANPGSDNPIAEGVAVVLIDEIELHLHPKWQREVVGHLRSVFKSCQFVVTTHSPIVLGEVEAGCVRFLDYIDGKVNVITPSESYGLDANRILQEFMGAHVRNRHIEEELNKLADLIDDEQLAAARSKITELEQYLGVDEPELTRANVLIRFLEGAE